MLCLIVDMCEIWLSRVFPTRAVTQKSYLDISAVKHCFLTFSPIFSRIGCDTDWLESDLSTSFLMDFSFCEKTTKDLMTQRL